MKVSEFRKLIREEVRKVIKEAKVSIVPSGKLGIKYKEDEGLLDAVKKKYKVTLKKKMPSDVADMPLEIYKIENTPYIIVDEAGFGAIYNESDYNKVIAMIKDETYFEMDESKKSVNEAITWDKKAILKFFKYLVDNHGMKTKPVFKTDTSGRVEIGGMPAFDAKFMVDGNNLILNPTSDSDMTAEEFVEDIEYDEVRTYKFKVKGKFVIVN